MLNHKIAQATGQLYTLETLISAGKLPTELCVSRQIEVQKQLTELRRKRQRLLKEDSSEELLNQLSQIMAFINNGPDELQAFDEAIFNELVRQIVVTEKQELRLQLLPGLEFQEVI